MDIHEFYRPLLKYFRTRRLRQFRRLFPEQSCGSVVDLGGGKMIWDLLGYAADITLINLDLSTTAGRYRLLIADALRTGLPDKSFDLAFSNSLIEHLRSEENQARLAAEMMRLAPQIYCQTPSRWFPVEPHYLGLFLHWIPVRYRPYWMYRYLTLWGWVVKPDREYVEAQKSEVRLLGKRELRRLFPGCEILTERVLGLPKSYVAVRRRSTQTAAASAPARTPNVVPLVR